MKLYTMQDAAEALGVNTETLLDWLARERMAVSVDPKNSQQYMLNEAQVEQLAREHPRMPVQSNPAPPQQENLPDLPPIPLGAPMITIGRRPENIVVLNHPQISGFHARMERVPNGGYRIVDLNSTNHIYVNGQRIRTQVLTPGDEIRIGPYVLTYTGNSLTQQDESYSIRIDAIKLKGYGKRHTLLLHDVSLDIPPRKFVAIVGSSGVGKSTLLNALSGVKPAQKGKVLYNGQDYYRNLAAFSTSIGYVPQDDIIHSDLTVEHALYYTARMRLPSDFTRAQIKQRVREVLEEVDMVHRRKLLVNRLSGGERKRVSIALELLANPSIFFLDEPTSGLDPGLDRKMMLLLRQLADKGHTIVMVTHATSNIHFCDYVCFMAQGGHLAFYGSPAEALTYFHTNDFAEIYNALESTDKDRHIPEQAEESFKRSPYYPHYIGQPVEHALAERDKVLEPSLPTKRVKRGNPARQFWLLTFRYLELLKNDVVNLMILLLQAPIIGLILFFLAGHATFYPTSIATCPLRANPLATSGRIVSIDCNRVVALLNSPQGTFYVQQLGITKQQALEDAIEPNSGIDAQTLLFIMAFAAVLFGCINGVRAIVKEVPVYRRERMVNLGIAPYMFSKIFVLGILCLLQSAILVYMVNLKAPYYQGIVLPSWIEIYITMALTTVAGLMLGLMISALAPNNDRAMSFVPIILIPQVIFSGIIFILNTPLLQAVGALFAARWAMAALGSIVGLHGDKLGMDSFSYQGTLFVSLNPQSAVPGAVIHLLIVWGALVAMIVILGAAIAFFLKQKDVR